MICYAARVLLSQAPAAARIERAFARFALYVVQQSVEQQRFGSELAALSVAQLLELAPCMRLILLAR